MAFEDLKDQLRDQITSLKVRIQESSAWNELMDRYLDLNPPAQKAVLALTGAVFALVLFSIPYYFFSSSQDSVAYFEEKKQMIRDLYRVSRAVNALPPAPPPMSTEELRSAVQGILSSERPSLLPDQIVSITEFDNSKGQGATLPKSLAQKGVAVNLSRLNVDQIARIGGRLQGLRPTIKMTGLRVQATAQDPHYFDVTYRLVAFGVPSAAEPPAPSRPGAARGGRQ